MSTAAGADTPAYSETAVDRPLIMYGGMTSLDVSEDFFTYVQTGVDANGNPTSATKVDYNLDLDVAHSFGVVQLSARVVGVAAIAAATVQLGSDTTIRGSVEWDLPQTTFRYSYVEGVGFSQRLLLLEHRLALFAGGSAYLLETSLTPINAPASAGSLLGGSAGASAVVQLLPRLAFTGGAGVGGAITHSSSLMFEGGLMLYCDGYLVDPEGKLAALALERADQPRVLERAGFVDVRLLHDEGNMALYSATNPE